jgi:BMFP domain-containing protein YqiC
MDLVSRDEFEAVKMMAAKARSEQEELQRRLAGLESQLAAVIARETLSNPAAGEASAISPDYGDC